MRKLVFFLAVCCAMMAQAATYNYLVFTSTGGTITAFSVDNLTLKANGSYLQVTNNEGTVNLALTDLASMQFSTDATGLEEILEADKPIDVYTTLGAKIGRFNSLVEAAQELTAGAYVISNGKNSQTIVLQ